MNVKELLVRAKELNITGRHRMKKADLITAIAKAESPPESDETTVAVKSLEVAAEKPEGETTFDKSPSQGMQDETTVVVVDAEPKPKRTTPTTPKRQFRIGYQVAGTVRNSDSKVGRNDPCPCGSGKKYKRCCMRNAA